MSNLTIEQIKELEESIKNSKPVAVSMQMSKQAFEFIVGALKICDQSRYLKEQNIQIISTSPVLGKYNARVLFSDSHSEMINLREER